MMQDRSAAEALATKRPHEPRCPIHDLPWVYSGVGYVRCPVIGCEQRRQTRCGAFIRRIRPYGHTLVCQEFPTVETWAVSPDGRDQYVTGRCAKHPDTARYVGPSRIEFRTVKAPPKPALPTCRALTRAGKPCRWKAWYAGGFCARHFEESLPGGGL